jgi:TadE-like protein
MVEFALVGPLLFAVLFGALDGGLFMYAKNSVDRAGEVGMTAIAAAGIDPNADVNAITLMDNNGLGTGALVRVSEIDVTEMTYNGTDYVTVSTCGTSGHQLCENAYDINGNHLWSTAGCADTKPPNPDAHWCPPWPPSNRSIHARTASFLRLSIKYTYKFFTGPPTFNLVSTHLFRLEPKDI